MFIVSFSICWLFSCFHSFVCTLLMFPLSLSTILIVALLFFCRQIFFKKKKNFSLPFILARPSCFFSVSFIISSFHLFLWNPFSFSSPFLVSSFFFVAFSNLVLSKKNFLIKINPFLTSPKLFFWISSRLKEKSQKLFLQHSFFDFSGRLRKCIFHFCLFWKTSFSFGERRAKQKLKFFQISLLAFSHVFLKNLSFF